MERSYAFERQVAFHETDMAGIAHFSNFFRWMEEAEHAFLRSIDFPPVRKDRSTYWGWPRSKASCDYKEPLRFGETFICVVGVKEIKLRSLVYGFRFIRPEAEGEERLIAKGEMTCVYAEFDVEEGTMTPLNLSQSLTGKIVPQLGDGET